MAGIEAHIAEPSGYGKMARSLRSNRPETLSGRTLSESPRPRIP
ncbi:hypothetical protein [Ralstonia solanacearum]|nr:hypothetical protein [Ralstonia solanacearum]